MTRKRLVLNWAGVICIILFLISYCLLPQSDIKLNGCYILSKLEMDTTIVIDSSIKIGSSVAIDTNIHIDTTVIYHESDTVIPVILTIQNLLTNTQDTRMKIFELELKSGGFSIWLDSLFETTNSVVLSESNSLDYDPLSLYNNKVIEEWKINQPNITYKSIFLSFNNEVYFQFAFFGSIALIYACFVIVFFIRSRSIDALFGSISLLVVIVLPIFINLTPFRHMKSGFLLASTIIIISIFIAFLMYRDSKHTNQNI